MKTSVAGESSLSYCILYRQGAGHRTFALNWMAPYLPLLQFPIAVTPVSDPSFLYNWPWAFQGCLLFRYNFGKDTVQHVFMPILTHCVLNENTMNNVNTGNTSRYVFVQAIVQ